MELGHILSDKGFPLVISGRNTRISTRRQEKADEAVKRLEEQEAEVEGNLRYEIFQFPNIVVCGQGRETREECTGPGMSH